jgi:DNA-binding LytR/AlgR family response regulator
MENHSHIFISTSGKIIPDEVIMLSADANYTHVHFSNGGKSTYARTLKSVEGQFTDIGFFRTHKSYLVNLQFFKEVHWDKANPFMVLSNDYRVSIARRKRSKLRRALNEMELGFNTV